MGLPWSGIGGMLIGLGGFTALVSQGRETLAFTRRILAVFPGLLLLTTAAFVAGFVFI